MAVQKIHVGDIGTRFKFTILSNDIVVDLSSASSINIIFKKPDLTELIVTGTLYTDGTDGIIYYNTASGDIDQSGIWKVQAIVVISGGTFHSNIGTFQVHCNL